MGRVRNVKTEIIVHPRSHNNPEGKLQLPICLIG
jgi:hypothetical protein